MIIQVKAVGLDNMRKFTNPETYRKAARRSLQRAGTAAMAEAPRAIKAVYNIRLSATEIKARLRTRVETATSLRLSAKAERGVSLTKYYGARRNKVGFSFRIKKGAPLSYLKGENKRRPFLGKMSSGYEGIFVRTSKARLPIKTFYGAGLGQLIRKRTVADRIQRRVDEVLCKELERNWIYYHARKSAA
ncbi:hypothetical protein [Seleniivibrio woodruffii]|uniref:hypothetical protein n=1 Tax=Seleniivibrio woodruffii TaxID=1078050 RepID=UPI002409F725|nr:hypothetical protein [Seleniivibrio woodruffii]